MANLAYYGSTSPAEFEAMDEDATLAFAREIDGLRKAHEDTMLQFVQILARAAARGG